MPKRIAVPWPPGLEKPIRDRAATHGLPVSTYFSLIAARGFHADLSDAITDRLDALTVAIDRLSVDSGAAGLSPAVLKTLADIYARTQLIAAKTGVDAAKVEALAAERLQQISSGGER